MALSWWNIYPPLVVVGVTFVMSRFFLSTDIRLVLLLVKFDHLGAGIFSTACLRIPRFLAIVSRLSFGMIAEHSLI